MESEKRVTIPRSRYDELVERSARLGALESAGVDGWEGYDAAMEVTGLDGDLE